MGELAERLELLAVEATSPDGGVTATARGRGDVRVSFARNTYPGYRAAGLARQLEALATLLWARYRRQYLKVIASWADRDDEPDQTDEDREFDRSLGELDAVGRSARGWVTVRSRALVSWRVELSGEPARSLTEREFLTELDSAVNALLSDYRARLTLLTDAVYDIGLPRALRTGGQGMR